MTDEVISEEVIKSFSGAEPGDKIFVFPTLETLYISDNKNNKRNGSFNSSQKAFNVVFGRGKGLINFKNARLLIWHRLRLMTELDIVESNDNHFSLVIIGEKKEEEHD